MNAPAETTPANTAYLKVLEALVQINEPAERNHIARRAGISPDDAGVQLVALADKRIVVRCPQPKGAPALWSLAVPLSTARQMVAGMKRAAAEASPAADDRRRIIAAMREIGAPASAFGIAKKSGVEMSNFSLFLEEMAADGVIQRIGGTSGQRPKFALIPSVQPQTPAATDGEPGDGTPAPEPGDTQAVGEVEAAPVPDHSASLDDPDNFGDDEMQTAAPGPDGWIPWNGGDCPVPEGGTCWVRLRDGSVVFADKPLNLAWGRCDILASPERRAVAPDEPLSPVWVRRNHPRDIVAYRLDTPAHLITPAYSAAVTAESAVDAAPLTGDDVCSTDAAIANWKREHAPAAPAATDGEPGDGAPDEDHEDEETAACADPDDFRDGDDRPTVADDAYGLDYDPRVAEAEAAAYDALVEAEAAADEAPLAGEDVNSGEDVIGDWCERHADPAEAAAEQIAAAVAAGHCPTVGLLIQRASPVAEEAAQRAIDDAEVEALLREKEANIALDMARDARARGIAAAEIIRFAEQRTGLAGDADPGAVLAAIVELLDGARSAVTGMSLPA